VPHPVLRVFYSRAEAFLFPSLYEGFGLPPLEAMAPRHAGADLERVIAAGSIRDAPCW